jgi:hypothetical protein
MKGSNPLEGTEPDRFRPRKSGSVKKVPNGPLQGLVPGAAFAQGYGEPGKSMAFRLKNSLK